MKRDRNGVKAEGRERVKEMKRTNHSLVIERSTAMERDNQSACLASVLC